jgi:hypothetical protein
MRTGTAVPELSSLEPDGNGGYRQHNFRQAGASQTVSTKNRRAKR